MGGAPVAAERQKAGWALEERGAPEQPEAQKVNWIISAQADTIHQLHRYITVPGLNGKFVISRPAELDLAIGFSNAATIPDPPCPWRGLSRSPDPLPAALVYPAVGECRCGCRILGQNSLTTFRPASTPNVMPPEANPLATELTLAGCHRRETNPLPIAPVI